MSSSHRIGYWGFELSWICDQGIGKGVRKKLWRRLWYATIDFIWQERDHHLHRGAVHEPMVIFQLIRSCIRARAASWFDGVHCVI